IHRAALDALAALGFPSIDDHNQPGAIGVGPMPMSSRAGKRVTSADAYLPVGWRPSNLAIRAESPVATVTVASGRATGVRLADGTEIGASWVVLSSGTYGSPSILIRSGIGPGDNIRALGLPVRVDLPGV